MTKTTLYTALFSISLVGSLFGCSSEDTAGSGSLQLEMGGGEAVRSGIPLTEGTIVHEFSDGWELSFSKYIIAIGNIKLTEQGKDTLLAEFAGPVILDLKKSTTAAEFLAELTDIPAERVDISFDLLRATADATSESADAEDITEMVAENYAFLIEGTATRDGDEVGFRLGLDIPTHYYECINGKDQTDGIAIEANKTVGAFIYAHAFHLFWDTLAAGDEELRFDAFAAMAGDDGIVTIDELEAQNLTDLRDADGQTLRDTEGNRVFYNDGGLLGPTELNLRAFVEYAMRASIHFNGVGLCRMEAL